MPRNNRKPLDPKSIEPAPAIAPARFADTTCSGCGAAIKPNGSEWCAACKATVTTIGVELSAEQFNRVKAAAVLRGITSAEAFRQAVDLLGGRPPRTHLTPEDWRQEQQRRSARKKRSRKR